MHNYSQQKDATINSNSRDIESQMLELTPENSFIKPKELSQSENYYLSNGKDVKSNLKRLPPHSSNGIAFYKQRVLVYNFLQRPHGLIAIGYHVFVSCVVFTCLFLTVASTTSDYSSNASICLKFIDSFIVGLFSAEFLVRLWSSSCVSHYRGLNGKLRFIRNPFRLIDIFVVVTSAIVLFLETKSQLLSTFLKSIRFIQVLQMLRLEHRFRPWRTMASVVWAQREHLAITTYMGFLALLFTSFLIYFLEKDSNPAFNSLASSLWWGVVTLCTIGYGDMYPITPIGKLLACICSLIGVSIFALPAGILGTGLALKVQEQQRQRKLCKRRIPAAKLIQSVWRCYASSKHSNSLIVLRAHLRNSNTKIYNLFSNQEMNAIRFILKVKYLVAKRDFSKALKPYDIKDVLEQYAAGHTDILATVKHMNHKLNSVQSIACTALKTQQESKYVLTDRLSTIEQILQDLQFRFNLLTEVQFQNKLLINELLEVSKCNHQNKLQTNSESNHPNMSGI